MFRTDPKQLKSLRVRRLLLFVTAFVLTVLLLAHVESNADSRGRSSEPLRAAQRPGNEPYRCARTASATSVHQPSKSNGNGPCGRFTTAAIRSA